MILIFEQLFARFVDADAQGLVDIARGQNAAVVYTRESEADIGATAHRAVVATACVLCYTRLCASVSLNLRVGKVAGASTLLLTGLGPLLLLRGHELLIRDGTRDQLIAEQLKAAAGCGDRIAAVRGATHAKTVPASLPAGLAVTVHEPAYGWGSRGLLRHLACPIVQLVRHARYGVSSGAHGGHAPVCVRRLSPQRWDGMEQSTARGVADRQPSSRIRMLRDCGPADPRYDRPKQEQDTHTDASQDAQLCPEEFPSGQ